MRPGYRRASWTIGLAAVVTAIGATSKASAQQTPRSTSSAGVQVAQQPSDKPSELPLAPLQPISFTVEEGTWMSVDVSPDGRLLAFDLLGHVFTMPIEGGRAQQLTSGSAFAARPKFSRSGQSLVFSSDRGGTVELWRLPVAGGTPERAIPADTVGVGIASQPGQSGRRATSLPMWSESFADVIWAPGRRYRASFRSSEERCRVLEVFDNEVGRIHVADTPLCAAGDQNEHFVRPVSAFTPDTQAFITWYGGKLRRIALATGTATVIPFTATVTLHIRPLVRFPHPIPQDSLVHARYIQYPRLSPNGQRLVFGAFGQLWLMSLPAGTPRRLPTLDMDAYEPVWSPDGRYIAFTIRPDTERGGKVEGGLYRIRVDGQGQPERLTTEGGWYSDLVYTADGRHLVAIWNQEHAASTTARQFGSLPRQRGERLVWIASAGGRVFTRPLPTSRCANSRGGALVISAKHPGAILLMQKSRDTVAALVRVPLQPQRDSLDSASSVLDVQFPDGRGMYACPMVLVSPDGTRVLVWSKDRLYLADVPAAPGPTGSVPTVALTPGSSYVRQLTSLAHGAEFPAWAPDSRSFAYAYGATLYRYDLGSTAASGKAKAQGSAPDERASADGTMSRPTLALTETRIPITVALPRDRPRGTLVFRNARLITMQGDRVIDRGDLIVRDRRITALGPTGTVAIPSDAHIIDATGQTIMPGLVDLHNHSGASAFSPGELLQTPAHYEINLAFGVLHSRDPQALSLDFLTYEDRVAAGLQVGARIRSTSSAVSSVPWERPITGMADARMLVGRYADVYRVDYLKDRLVGRRDARQWLVMAAAERGLNVVAHGIGYSHLVQSAIDGYGGYDHESFVWPMYDDVHQLLARTGITLAHHITKRTPAVLDSTGWAFLARWLSPLGQYELGPDGLPPRAPGAERSLPASDRLGAMLVAAAAAGGRIAMSAHGVPPGLGTHDVTSAMVESGMPPLEALRSATLRGAEALGLEQDLGSLEVGKLADLIVLDANPLEKIDYTAKLRQVLFNGRLYDATTLKEVWPRQRPGPPWTWQTRWSLKAS